MPNESANPNNFTYENVEVTKVGGKKIVRKV